jgi:dihydroorotase
VGDQHAPAGEGLGEALSDGGPAAGSAWIEERRCPCLGEAADGLVEQGRTGGGTRQERNFQADRGHMVIAYGVDYAAPATGPGLYDLIIEDATIISGSARRVADIAVEGGQVAYVGNRPGGPARQTVRAIGRFAIPGMVDTHVHFRSPGNPEKEDWASGSRAALSGGVTTVCDMPNTWPPTITRAAFAEKRALAEAHSRADFGIWAGASAEHLGEAAALAEGDACGIKVFMGASTGPLLVDGPTLERVFRETTGLIGVHAEDETILLEHRSRFTGVEKPAHHEVRPDEAAVAAVRRLVELVRDTGRPVHICHVSTGAELELLEATRGELPITTEVSPHHLWLTSEDDLGNFGKCNPPLRPEMDRRALWTALRRGHVDTVASDHAPHTREQKQLPYWEAPAGIPGVETTLPVMLTATRHGRLTIERLVQLACEAPARIFRLARKGRLEPGFDADIVLFTEGELTRLGPAHLLTRVGWSPFLGQRLAPKPEQVFLGGKLVAARGTVVDDDVRGRLLRPE